MKNLYLCNKFVPRICAHLAIEELVGARTTVYATLGFSCRDPSVRALKHSPPHDGSLVGLSLGKKNPVRIPETIAKHPITMFALYIYAYSSQHSAEKIGPLSVPYLFFATVSDLPAERHSWSCVLCAAAGPKDAHWQRLGQG